MKDPGTAIPMTITMMTKKMMMMTTTRTRTMRMNGRLTRSVRTRRGAGYAVIASLALIAMPTRGAAQVRAAVGANQVTWPVAQGVSIPSVGRPGATTSAIGSEPLPIGPTPVAPAPHTPGWATPRFAGTAALAAVGSYAGLYLGGMTGYNSAKNEYDELTYVVVGAGIGTWLGSALGATAMTRRPLRAALASVAGMGVGALVGVALQDESLISYALAHGVTTAALSGLRANTP